MTIADADVVSGAPDSRPEPMATARIGSRRLLEELHVIHTAHLQRIDGEVMTESDPDDELVLRTQSSSRHWLLGEIEDAIERIADGTYGKCEDCRSVIPSGRLETIPYARRCTACQRKSARRISG